MTALTRKEMDEKIDEHFGFEARDDVAGGILGQITSFIYHRHFYNYG